MAHENAEQYGHLLYQRAAELESEALQGLTLEERQKREVDFGLRVAHLKLGRGDKILDLACGGGRHAFLMAKKTGVSVDARDISQPLIDWAKETYGPRRETRGRLNFAYGDMSALDADDGLRPDSYKLVTIYGNSFMYLGTKEAHQKALIDVYERLQSGGKLVIQFREAVGKISPEFLDERLDKPAGIKRTLRRRFMNSTYDRRGKVVIEKKQAEGPDGSFGKFAEPGESVPLIRDVGRGDAFYFYGFKDFGLDEDGVERSSHSKAYIDEDGVEYDLGSANLLSYVETKSFPALKRMMEQAGFKNVSLRVEDLSDDGEYKNIVVVGEK